MYPTKELQLKALKWIFGVRITYRKAIAQNHGICFPKKGDRLYLEAIRQLEETHE